MRDAVRVGVVHLASVLLDHFLPRADLLRRQVLLIVRDEEHAAQQTQVLWYYKRIGKDLITPGSTMSSVTTAVTVSYT